jgi:hypothetical protein
MRGFWRNVPLIFLLVGFACSDVLQSFVREGEVREGSAG